MSSIGGTLRVGELLPGAPPIHHVLKINLQHHNSKLFRWPAITCDLGGRQGETFDFTGINVNLEGGLYALPPSIDIKSMGLETELGKYLARAFQDYGAFLVDGTGWSVYAIETEWSPDGRVIDEFQKAWGFPFQNGDLNSPWARDMAKIFTALNVVMNSARGQTGGGPDSDFANRRAPKAPNFKGVTIGIISIQGKNNILMNPINDSKNYEKYFLPILTIDGRWHRLDLKPNKNTWTESINF